MSLIIVQPVRNAVFNISALPQMPTIQCQAMFIGVPPNPNLAFDWSIEITETVQASSCPSSRIGRCRLLVSQQGVRGGDWTPVFNSIQGGDARITVYATFQQACWQASVDVRIRGVNPAAASITQRLGGAGTAGDRIACRESGRRQFDATGMPLLGRGGDVGVMQLCSPAATCVQRWSWTANVDAGLALLAQKRTAAQTYLNQHRVQGHYPNNQNLNNADVLLRETIQRYNGGAYWTWNAANNRWEANPPNQYVANVLACQ